MSEAGAKPGGAGRRGKNKMVGWIRFWITAALLVIGLISFFAAVVGNYRFGYILNRVHAGGIGDTQGLLFVVLALVVSCNSALDILKLGLLVVFMWNTSPVSSHFLSQIAYYTDRELWNHVDRLRMQSGENEASED